MAGHGLGILFTVLTGPGHHVHSRFSGDPELKGVV